MAAGNCFDSPIKHANDTVVLEPSFNSDKISQKGLRQAVASSSTGESEGKHQCGLASAFFGCGESQRLKTDVVYTDSHLDFQEPENLSNEDRIDLESLEFKKLQLVRDRSIFGGMPDSVANAMTVDGNVIVGDVVKIEDHYKVDGSDTSLLKMKLIDDTAVIEPFTGHQKNVKRLRRKGKGGKKAKMAFQYNYGGDGANATYSREELLAMRFVGVVKQKRLWREIYDGLGSVAEEYASLVVSKNPKPRNPLAPGILGPISGSGRPNPYNMVVHPNITTPLCTPKAPYRCSSTA